MQYVEYLIQGNAGWLSDLKSALSVKFECEWDERSFMSGTLRLKVLVDSPDYRAIDAFVDGYCWQGCRGLSKEIKRLP